MLYKAVPYEDGKDSEEGDEDNEEDITRAVLCPTTIGNVGYLLIEEDFGIVSGKDALSASVTLSMGHLPYFLEYSLRYLLMCCSQQQQQQQGRLTMKRKKL